MSRRRGRVFHGELESEARPKLTEDIWHDPPLSHVIGIGHEMNRGHASVRDKGIVIEKATGCSDCYYPFDGTSRVVRCEKHKIEEYKDE